MDLSGTGIDPAALERFIEEQIYALPGTDRHREQFSILLTGSRDDRRRRRQRVGRCRFS